MKVADWLKRRAAHGVTVAPDASLEEAARRLLEEPASRDVYITDAEGRVVGHLGFSRLAGLLLFAPLPTHSRRQMLERVARGPVGEFMDHSFIAARLDQDVEDVLHQHMERWAEDIPVLDDEQRLLSVIRVRDLVAAALEE